MSGHQTLALIACWALATQLSHGQAPSPTKPSPIPTRMTRQADFRIPFQLSDETTVAPREVRLFVANAITKEWKLYQKQPPEAGGFQFRAPQDGEYWFAVRTVDQQGQLISHQGWQPEMKVIVDSRPPTLSLTLQLDADGRAAAEWHAEDPNLALHTFRLEYQDADGQWRRVDLQNPPADDWRQEWQSSIRWQIDPTRTTLVARAEILDRAGNRVGVQEVVSAPAQASASSAQRPWVADRPRDRFSAEPLAATVSDPKEPPPAAQLPSWLTRIEQSDAYGAAPDKPLEMNDPPRPWDRTVLEPLSSRIEPPVAQQVKEATTRPAAVDRLRFLASPNFALDYELVDISPQGVRRVELWLSRDGGNSWELYGADADRVSPMEVQVDKEGLYGLQLLVHPLENEPPPAPRSGDPPDIVVGIDWNKPFARIRRASYDPLDRGTITIEWQAEDALLQELPITLRFAASSKGPWQLIASQLPNSGIYRWRPVQALPNLVYMQLEVADRAGNVTQDVYGSPVSRGQPRGFIRDVRPAGTTSRPQLQR